MHGHIKPKVVATFNTALFFRHPVIAHTQKIRIMYVIIYCMLPEFLLPFTEPDFFKTLFVDIAYWDLKRLEARINDGGPLIYMKTTNGSIRIDES